MRITTRSVHTLTLDDDTEVDLDLKPAEHVEPMVERVGDKLVVAYLVHDETPSNPLTDHDCQGNIYTKGSSYARNSKITDNNAEMYSALGLDYSGSINFDCKIDSRDHSLSLLDHLLVITDVEGEKRTLREQAVHEFLQEEGGHDLAVAWAKEMGLDLVLNDEDLYNGFHDEIWQDLIDGNFRDDDIDDRAIKLYAQHWRAIAGPYVVPISYFAERGGCMISPTSWDGDTDDLPDGVWVADKGAKENIDAGALPTGIKIEYRGALGSETDPTHCVVIRGDEVLFDSGPGVGSTFSAAVAWCQANLAAPSHSDIHAAAIDYAKSVCSEYASWCEGDVWGCVIETFRWEGGNDWKQLDVESCWGFIGTKWATKALKEEYFDPAVESLRSTKE